MPLPTLDVPTYECELPSTGEKIKYRPFLVREHKVILTLMDSDVPEVAKGITELIDVCTFKKLDINKLSHFDIEYLFLQLRSKSIGENVSLVVNCTCGAKIPHTINLDEVHIERKEGFTNKIQITDKVGIVLKYPKFEDVVKIFYDEMNVDSIMDVVKNCIEAVWDENEYYDSFTSEEIDYFLNSLSKEQFKKLEDFFINMPKVVQPISKECPECGKLNEVRLEGLQNFFV